MSNNSFVTPDGKEIGRAQAVQAAACRLPPRADFNPILIKPESHTTAQLVVGGEVVGALCAKDFGRVRREYWSAAQEAFQRLSQAFDIATVNIQQIGLLMGGMHGDIKHSSNEGAGVHAAQA